MHDILEIDFKGRRKEFARNPLQFPFIVGDLAIVEVERGQDLGKISYLGQRAEVTDEQAPSLTVIRKAGPADIIILEQNRHREKDARSLAKQKIAHHKLDMKLVDIELQWDGRKMTFYFTADGRVDFRELVKDLASSFRTRIDLRQIGARDETKRTGGYGVCGQPLCCATFLTEFKPITTQMPRDQFLPLNPSKLSGVCGRLKCCLRYELDVYREFQRSCPKLGHAVKDETRGDGVIEKLDLIREQIQIKYGNGDLEKMSTEEFRQNTNWKPEMPKNECICICGRKPPSAPPPKTEESREEEEIQPIRSEGAERVTLLPGGGIGIKSSTGGEDVQVGTDLSVTPKGDQPAKKKRKR
ncbi:MAG: PSP1 domain-containing protein, partial [Calditrichota bacterium]